MPRRNRASSQTSGGDSSNVIGGDVSGSTIINASHSTIIFRDGQSAPESLSPVASASRLTGHAQSQPESDHPKLVPFLCYAKENAAIVRSFSERLKSEGWIDPWFDEEDILPGQKWEDRVVQAVRESHAVIIFLSQTAVTSDGFFHKELKLALDTSAEKPDGTIFIIPIRLDDCTVPERLKPYQYLNFFESDVAKQRAYGILLKALQVRAEGLGIR